MAKFKPSAILGFFTGRHYAEGQTPTVAYGSIAAVFEGRPVFTHELADMIDRHKDKVLDQLPPDFKSICENWEHTPDWKTRVELVDGTFHDIELTNW